MRGVLVVRLDLEGHGDLVSGLVMGITGVIMSDWNTYQVPLIPQSSASGLGVVD